MGAACSAPFSLRTDLANHDTKIEGEQMKNLLCAVFVIGMVSSCGLGNSSVGSSANSASSAASGSSAGSANIFGRRNRASKQQQAQVAAATDETGRTLAAFIKSARIERTRDGGIVRARAVMPRQGYYDAALISQEAFETDENGVLVLEFRAVEPEFNTLQSTERSREVDVGVFLSNQRLAAIRAIRVVGRQNQVTLSR